MNARPDVFYPIVPDLAWLARLVPLGVKTVQLRLKDAPPEQLELRPVAGGEVPAVRVELEDLRPGDRILVMPGAYPPFHFSRGVSVIGMGDDPGDVLIGRCDLHVTVPAEGYDAIFENPLLAGADTSFWIRQPVPLIGGGRVVLSGRNGLLNSLRSSKEFGQSNFTNPGLVLAGLGADLDLTPTLRASVNANGLWFADTTVLEAARMQAGIDREIGLDLSVALTWRPLASQNIVLRLSAAALVPGKGFKDLYGKETPYSILGNLVFSY